MLRQKPDAQVLEQLERLDAEQLDDGNLHEWDHGGIVQRKAEAFVAKNPRLDFLNLNGNASLCHGGSRHLAELLSDGPQGGLRSLFLSDCALGDGGIRWLAGSLRANRCLQILELRHNSATAIAAEALADALRENPSLESLYLNNDQWAREEQRNCVGDEGAWALAFMMVDRSAALKVSLQGNGISEQVQGSIRDILGRKMRF